MPSTEAQKRAARKYYLKNKEYYSMKSNESMKKIRKEHNDYKERIDKAITYINEKMKDIHILDQYDTNKLVMILKGEE